MKPHRFEHEAMGTVFETWISHDDLTYCKQAVVELWMLLDEIESELSFYREGSDISRINALHYGESILIGSHAMRSLLIAMQVSNETGGLFDPNVGEQMKKIKDSKGFASGWKEWISEKFKTQKKGSLIIDEEERSVTLADETPVSIDLGALGKGYALDRMTEFLDEWLLPHHLLSGGGSSLLAGLPPEGKEGWEIAVGGKDFLVSEISLGASGIPVKGVHIVNPHDGSPTRRFRAWSIGKSAARTDALSTAAMILPREWFQSRSTNSPQEKFVIQETANTPPHFFDPLPFLEKTAESIRTSI